MPGWDTRQCCRECHRFKVFSRVLGRLRGRLVELLVCDRIQQHLFDLQEFELVDFDEPRHIPWA